MVGELCQDRPIPLHTVVGLPPEVHRGGGGTVVGVAAVAVVVVDGGGRKLWKGRPVAVVRGWGIRGGGDGDSDGGGGGGGGGASRRRRRLF